MYNLCSKQNLYEGTAFIAVCFFWDMQYRPISLSFSFSGSSDFGKCSVYQMKTILSMLWSVNSWTTWLANYDCRFELGLFVCLFVLGELLGWILRVPYLQDLWIKHKLSQKIFKNLEGKVDAVHTQPGCTIKQWTQFVDHSLCAHYIHVTPVF